MALINILKTIYSKCKKTKVEPTPNQLPSGRNCPKYSVSLKARCKEQDDYVSSIEDTIYEKFFDILHVGGSAAVLYPLS
jgi:hypothetical protein